jgi:sugar lactone lactonase YvrE
MKKSTYLVRLAERILPPLAGIFLFLAATIALVSCDPVLTQDKWSEAAATVGKGVIVTYHANGADGGAVPVDPLLYSSGGQALVLGNPLVLRKSGLAFRGWNIAADGSGTHYDEGESLGFGNSSVKLHADWGTVQVQYHGNGNSSGIVPVDGNNYIDGQGLTILGNTGNLVQAERSFLGWRVTDPDNGGFFLPGHQLTIEYSLIRDRACTFFASYYPTITTVAGTSYYGYSGDDGPATSISLYQPRGIALDESGNLYIADTDNHRIRRVDTNGLIATVVGEGSPGFLGDGGPAASARLFFPFDIALDGAGNLYIADYYNHRIRKVDTNGIITTVAGNGSYGFSGDGGSATSASLYNPSGIAVDNTGTLYIADFYNNRIRKVDTNGLITTVAGNGSYGFSGDGVPATSASLYSPTSIAVDITGNLYIADKTNNRIRKVDTNGLITTVAGNGSYGFSGDGGPATSASLHSPSGIAVDAAGNLYIADQSNHRIRKVDMNGLITTVAGNGLSGFSGDGGPATSAKLSYPLGIAIDGEGYLYIADTYNNRIRRMVLP